MSVLGCHGEQCCGCEVLRSVLAWLSSLAGFLVYLNSAVLMLDRCAVLATRLDGFVV